MTSEPTNGRGPAALTGIPWPHRLGTRIFLATVLVACAVLAGLAATDVPKLPRPRLHKAAKSLTGQIGLRRV